MGSPPEVSVVIPVYNGEATIGRCLDSVLEQDPDAGSFEVVVVDNGSTDATPRLLDAYPVRRVHAMPRGRPVARNAGLREAAAPLVAFLDADCWAAPGWLRGMRERLESENFDAVGGDVRFERPLEEFNLYELQQYLKAFTFESYVTERHFICTSTALFRRRIYEQIGGFDEALLNSEDWEWFRRAWKAGFRLGFARDSVAYTDPRSDLRSFLEREFRLGFGCGQVGVRHDEPEEITFYRPLRYRPPLSILAGRYSKPVPPLGPGRRLSLFLLYWASYFVREAGNFRGWWATRIVGRGEEVPIPKAPAGGAGE